MKEDTKALDVCALVLKRDGGVFREPIMDDRLYLLTESGKRVPSSALTEGENQQRDAACGLRASPAAFF